MRWSEFNVSIIAGVRFSRTLLQITATILPNQSTILRIGTANLLIGLILTGSSALAEESLNQAIENLFDTRAEDSHKFERWFHLYTQGKIAEADKVWSAMLKDMAKTPSIAEFLENINSRCWFAEDENNIKAPKKARLDATKIYEHLLERTEKELGKEHRFCGDICKFLAMYWESQKDYKKSKSYRLREYSLHEKWLGPKHEITLLSMLALAKLQIKMKENEGAEALLRKVIAQSDEVRTPKRYHDGIKMYIEFLKSTGRDTDAKRVIAKYKTYMWTR